MLGVAPIQACLLLLSLHLLQVHSELVDHLSVLELLQSLFVLVVLLVRINHPDAQMIVLKLLLRLQAVAEVTEDPVNLHSVLLVPSMNDLQVTLHSPPTNHEKTQQPNLHPQLFHPVQQVHGNQNHANKLKLQQSFMNDIWVLGIFFSRHPHLFKRSK